MNIYERLSLEYTSRSLKSDSVVSGLAFVVGLEVVQESLGVLFLGVKDLLAVF